MVTSHDVARVAGVSQTTVSRVLSDSPNVRPETRARVQEALRETGYAPNAMARAMRTHRTGTVGVVVARITNPFYPQIVRQLGHGLGALGLRMTLWDAEGPGEQSAVEAIRQGLVDGLIFTTATAESNPLQEAIALRAPVVLVNRVVEGLACDQVTNENHQAGRMVASYLLQAGHTQVGLVAGPDDASTSREREAGFIERLEESAVPLRPEFVFRGDFGHSTGYKAVRVWFNTGSELSPPTAIFCVNDLIAFGALDGARSLNIDVPHDLSVVGHDDIEMASWEAFSLSTIRQRVDRMVETALELLVARIQDPDRAPQFHRFPCELILRGSTQSAEQAANG